MWRTSQRRWSRRSTRSSAPDPASGRVIGRHRDRHTIARTPPPPRPGPSPRAVHADRAGAAPFHRRGYPVRASTWTLLECSRSTSTLPPFRLRCQPGVVPFHWFHSAGFVRPVSGPIATDGFVPPLPANGAHCPHTRAVDLAIRLAWALGQGGFIDSPPLRPVPVPTAIAARRPGRGRHSAPARSPAT